MITPVSSRADAVFANVTNAVNSLRSAQSTIRPLGSYPADATKLAIRNDLHDAVKYLDTARNMMQDAKLTAGADLENGRFHAARAEDLLKAKNGLSIGELKTYVTAASANIGRLATNDDFFAKLSSAQ